jgi:anti-anti-sigma factor
MSFIVDNSEFPTYSIFKLKGRILSDEDLKQAHALLENRKNWKLILDLSELSNTNSIGIAFMVKCLTRARINQGEVVLIQPNTALQRVFEITKMHEVFKIMNDLDAAINYLNQ